ncbi:MAG: endonuclease/exonuclease/phosphatase family protein [Myxococcales bacterium]|nr:endonuclease/exonuclease/phosphatase family protein [Myxococcales bacterium]MCB9646245.1 endonuclease/exonuclease/phosphatase family protein [Deltaproteobacteria bacterium]
MRRHLGTLALTTALLAAGPARGEEELPLRVLSFNAWGIWMVSPAREARIEAMGPAIAALAPDVVAMQEVWVDEDAERLADALARAGLPHSQRFYSTWPGNSGLLIASRYPIERAEFVEYAEGTYPDIPWHVDWLAGKGMARVRLRTPAGPVDVASTHVQAAYGSRRYELIQLSQLLEGAEFLEGSDDVPLIVAGDLNVGCDSLPYRAFAQRLDLRPTDPECGIDSISVRGGGGRDLAVWGVRKVLDTPVRLSDGSEQRLSDHDGLVADLTLRPGHVAPARISTAARWLDVTREALGRIYTHRTLLSRHQLRDIVLAGAMLQVALLLLVVWRKQRPTNLALRRPLAALATAALAAGLWFGYLGASYAPKHMAELNQVRQRLESALSAGMLGAR